MANSHAEIFSSHRIEMLDTLVDSRNSIDDAFGTLPEAMIRRQFKTVILQMQKYLRSPSPMLLSQAVRTWSAALLSLGLSPRSVLRTVVTIGDLVVQVSKQKLAPGPATNLFVREVVRLNFASAREVVALFNDELSEQRTAQRAASSGQGA